MVCESKDHGKDEVIAQFVFLYPRLQFSKKPPGVPLEFCTFLRHFCGIFNISREHKIPSSREFQICNQNNFSFPLCGILLLGRVEQLS